MNKTFINACYGRKGSYTPVWIMRQAGRYLPQYQEVRGKVDFLTLCKTPELAAKVTLQPVDILNVDAAILFSDILIPAEAMGLELNFYEERGPVFSTPVRDYDGANALKIVEPIEDVPFVLDTIKILSVELKNKVPLIGFAGAPFTVATYIIEGGSSKTYLHTKSIMYKSPELFKSIMEKVTVSTVKYLNAQIDAGVNAIQLFDSWAGVLSPDDYTTFVMPYVEQVINSVKKDGVPFIYFVNNCAGLIDKVGTLKADVYGIDWRIEISRAINALGSSVCVQGNMDPCILFSEPKTIKEKAHKILENVYNANGHVFNLGHGILPQTPVDNVKALVDIVHEYS